MNRMGAMESWNTGIVGGEVVARITLHHSAIPVFPSRGKGN